MTSQSFCVNLDDVQYALIDELHKKHPGALPISVEYKMKSESEVHAVIWWVPPTEAK